MCDCAAVIATLGPACRDVDTLVAMLDAGLSAVRIDLTVGAARQGTLLSSACLPCCHVGRGLS